MLDKLIVPGTLYVYESFHGYYLYGLAPDGSTVYIGSLGDGTDGYIDSAYDPNDEAEELAEAYGFYIVELA